MSELYSLLAEDIVIATILSSQDAIASIEAIVSPEAFYHAFSGQIFGAAVKLNLKGDLVNPETVANFLISQPSNSAFDVRKAVFEAYQKQLPSPSAIEYAQIIQEKYKSRQYVNFLMQAQGLFQEQSFDEAKSWFDQELVKLRKIENMADTRVMYDVMGEEFLSIISVAEKQEKGEADDTVLKTPFYDLDSVQGDGIPPARLITVLGATGMGKTTFLLELLNHTSFVLRQPSLFFSLEMESRSQAQKLFSKHAKIDVRAIQSGKIPPDKWDALAQAQQNYAGLPMEVNDRVRTIEDIVSISRQFYAKYGSISMIGIDYLTLVKAKAKPNAQKRDVADYVLEELNQLKKELNTRIVVLCQVGRNVDNLQNKRPNIHSAKESGGIEEASDLIYGCYRDEYYNPDTSDRGIIELSVIKNRYGDTGTAKFLWEPQHSSIYNLVKW